MAMPTRMMIGITVQATSSNVLWVVLEGTGFDFELKRQTMYSSSTSTNNDIRVMRINMLSWNATSFSMTGVAGVWKFICQG